ncbi:hemerythrin HHE cation binding domain protein [Mycobacterium kansasii]|uniref:Hemerythrin HHE cation binding domain protein n=1 Tax=Mycobacterium kansasii TaxID=1768 RepID=A0A1V3X2J7_MYCKA|nr:hemerythrin HHE cation binding domain protein [Mycobacterium kansasii]
MHLMSASRRLKRRLDSEARRRGQRVPRFDELGFTKSER